MQRTDTTVNTVFTTPAPMVAYTGYATFALLNMLVE